MLRPFIEVRWRGFKLAFIWKELLLVGKEGDQEGKRGSWMILSVLDLKLLLELHQNEIRLYGMNNGIGLLFPCIFL